MITSTFKRSTGGEKVDQMEVWSTLSERAIRRLVRLEYQRLLKIAKQETENRISRWHNWLKSFQRLFVNVETVGKLAKAGLASRARLRHVMSRRVAISRTLEKMSDFISEYDLPSTRDATFDYTKFNETVRVKLSMLTSELQHLATQGAKISLCPFTLDRSEGESSVYSLPSLLIPTKDFSVSNGLRKITGKGNHLMVYFDREVVRIFYIVGESNVDESDDEEVQTNHTHPHLDSEHICLGDTSVDVSLYLNNYAITEAVTIVEDIIGNPNEEGAYGEFYAVQSEPCEIEDCDDSQDTGCSACGTGVCSGHSYSCSHRNCGEGICHSCARNCENCSDYFCETHSDASGTYTLCKDCLQTTCNECIHALSSCDYCNKKFCPHCDGDSELPELCEDCRQKKKDEWQEKEEAAAAAAAEAQAEEAEEAEEDDEDEDEDEYEDDDEDDEEYEDEDVEEEEELVQAADPVQPTPRLATLASMFGSLD